MLLLRRDVTVFKAIPAAAAAGARAATALAALATLIYEAVTTAATHVFTARWRRRGGGFVAIWRGMITSRVARSLP